MAQTKRYSGTINSNTPRGKLALAVFGNLDNITSEVVESIFYGWCAAEAAKIGRQTGQPVVVAKRSPRQPKKPPSVSTKLASTSPASASPTTSVSGSSPEATPGPVPETPSSVVSEPTFAPVSEPDFEPDFIQKPASGNLVQNNVPKTSSDAILAMLKQKNNPEAMLEVSKKLQKIG